ncbi:MAG: DUF4367 domain-containing protein [Bacillota bacterium]|nr:DUF4367 domain-containing protein [Bacillota bacterium]
MSKDTHNSRDMDVTLYDKMSTAELEELLRQDAVFGDSNESSINELIYIMELVANRKRVENPSEIIDVKEAKKSFDENYRPIAERGETLFEEEASEPEAIIQSGTHRRFFRTAIAIAAVVALMLAASVVASAMGFNVWNHVADWTHEVFGYGEKYDRADTLFEFSSTLEKNGIDPNILPTYIPEGYEVVSVDKLSNPAYEKYLCELSNGTYSIVIEYVICEDNRANELEKESDSPDIQTYNGTDYYFVNNDGKNYVSWSNGEVDGSIFYTDSELDIERIIKSIPGE